MLLFQSHKILIYNKTTIIKPKLSFIKLCVEIINNKRAVAK